MKNTNNFKVALLIQGPLKSVGRSGKNACADLKNLEIGDVVSYDCRKSIKKLLKKYGHLFNQIILSTWDDEILEYEDNSIEIYKFNKNKVPKLPDKWWINDSYVSKNNMFYQFYGCLFGLKKIRKDINYVIKIRTDLIINLQEIYDFLKENYEKDTILVPKFNSKGTYFEDLYFAGNMKIIRKFLESITKRDEQGTLSYHDSPHTNPILKLAYAEEKESLPFEEKYYKSYGFGSLEQYIILYHTFNKYFRALPFDIAKKTKWRGTVFSPNSAWIKSYHEKLIFNCNKFYNKNSWKTNKKVRPRIKSYLSRIINNLIKN